MSYVYFDIYPIRKFWETVSSQNFHICFLFLKHLSGITSYLAKISVKSPDRCRRGSRKLSGQFPSGHHSWAKRYISWRYQFSFRNVFIHLCFFLLTFSVCLSKSQCDGNVYDDDMNVLSHNGFKYFIKLKRALLLFYVVSY